MMARMQVSASGGPIHAPHERVLQLMIEPWEGDYESWTVYRHKTDRSESGKLVFKKWDYKAERKRFQTLKLKTRQEAWKTETGVSERQFPLPARWVSNLERMVETLSVPPVAGPVKPLTRDTEYLLSFWRSRQRSEFRWHGSSPAGWRPLERLFKSLLRTFREHQRGKALVAVQER
jgi:hypothetical protein